MKRILIINLRRFGDIFSSAHLIGSYINEQPFNEINLLTYQECLPAAKCLKNIKNIYTIDRKKLLLLKNNPLFSGAHALDFFWNELTPVASQEWDEVVNYSNELASAHLVSFIRNKQVRGIKVSTAGTVAASNNWARFFNEVMPYTSYSPIHFVDCYHQMTDLHYLKSDDGLKTSPDNDRIVSQNFKNLKATYQKAEDNLESLKIVGIQLKSSSAEKDIPIVALAELIDKMLKSKRYIPLLLVSPSEIEKNLANELNKKFNNKLLSVETDFLAVPSVIRHLDCIVTPDTSIKHIADLVGTSMLEVSLGPSPMHKQGSIGTGNLILSPIISRKRNVVVNLTGDDLYNSLECLLFNDNSVVSNLSDHLTLYRVCTDNAGTYYKPIAGSANVDEEIRYLIGRYYCHKLFNNSELDEMIFQVLSNFEQDEVASWANNEREAITKVVKDLLSVLRSLKEAKRDRSHGPNFLENLQTLLSYCSKNILCAIPLFIFRGSLEAITSRTIEENIKEMESLLFQLKSDIQVLTNALLKLDELRSTKERENRMSQALMHRTY